METAINKYIKMLGMGYQEGRAGLAPEVHQILNKIKCTRYNATSSKIMHRVRIKDDNNSKSAKSLGRPSHSHVFEGCGVGDVNVLGAGCFAVAMRGHN